MTVEETIQELASYALSKKGAELEYGGRLTKEVLKPCVRLPLGGRGNFFQVIKPGCFEPFSQGTVANLPVTEARFAEIQKKVSSDPSG